jgi:hypothetical protein
MLMKKLTAPDGEASLVPIVKATATRMSAVRAELESAGVWKGLSDTVTDDIQLVARNLMLIGRVMAGLDENVTKFHDEFEIDKDEMLLRDVNFATSMLISLKGVFEEVAATMGEPSAALASVADTTLETLRGVADLLTEVVTGMQEASTVGKSVTKAEEDDPVTEEKDETTPPEGATNEALLAAIQEMSGKFDAVTEQVEPEVLLSPEQIAEGLELFPTMTEEEQASFSAILETQAADIPYDGELDTPVTDGGDDAEEAVA